MRFHFTSALGLAALALADIPLVTKLNSLDDVVGQLDKILVGWNGGLATVLPNVAPTLSHGTQMLTTIWDIVILSNNAGTLSQEDADEVLEALKKNHERRPVVEKHIIERKAAFAGLSRGFLDTFILSIRLLINQSDEAHAAIRKAMPENKKNEVDRLAAQGRQTLEQVQSAYGS